MFSVIVVGGCAVDEGYRATSPNVTHNKMLATSTPCRFLFRSAGGVGRNLADVLRKLLPDDTYHVDLISAVGQDTEGTFVLARCKDSNLGTKHIIRLQEQTKLVDATRHEEFRSESEQEDLKPRPASTAKYVAILDGTGELAAAAAAMTIFESKQFYDHISKSAAELVAASAVVVDTNLPAPHFKLALSLARQQKSSSSTSSPYNSFKLVAIDPISVEKGRRVVPVLMRDILFNGSSSPSRTHATIKERRNVMTIIKPNHIEASAMAEEVLSRATAQLDISLDELTKRLRELLPRQPLPSSANSINPYFNSLSSVNNHHHHISDILSSSTANPTTLQAYSSMSDVSQQLLYEASRNAVILMFMMELDLVIVSCGSNGSIACFASANENERQHFVRNNTNQTPILNEESDMGLLEFNTFWRTVPLEPGRNYYLRWFPPRKVRKVEKVTGAGDTFFGSIISHLLLSVTIPPGQDDEEDDEDGTITNENAQNPDEEVQIYTSGAVAMNSKSVVEAVNPDYYVWKKLDKKSKGQHITNAIENASTNASLALMTKKGATPKLVTLGKKGLSSKKNNNNHHNTVVASKL